MQFGSEPLFDSVLTASALAAQVTAAKETLAPLGVPVTVSDMVYGFTKDGGSEPVLEAIDQISIHELPFFSSTCRFRPFFGTRWLMCGVQLFV